MIFNSGSYLETNSDGSHNLKVKGIANFLATLKLESLMAGIQPKSKVTVDFSEAKLVDFSILEHIYNFQRIHINSGGSMTITGLEDHNSSSSHKLSLKTLSKKVNVKLTRRQVHLAEISEKNEWDFNPNSVNNLNFLESFYFFQTRPLEIRDNTIISKNEKNNWEICDVIFEEGAYAAADEYQTTLCLVNSSKELPKFVIERKNFTTTYLNASWHKDIDYKLYPNFSKDFIMKVDDIDKMDSFLSTELKSLIENSTFPHLECNGEAIMIFDAKLRLAPISYYVELVRFAEEMQRFIK